MQDKSTWGPDLLQVGATVCRAICQHSGVLPDVTYRVTYQDVQLVMITGGCSCSIPGDGTAITRLVAYRHGSFIRLHVVNEVTYSCWCSALQACQFKFRFLVTCHGISRLHHISVMDGLCLPYPQGGPAGPAWHTMIFFLGDSTLPVW